MASNNSGANLTAAELPSEKDIASKQAQISAMLTAGGTNARMKELWLEYQKLDAERKAAKAASTNNTANTSAVQKQA
ncbi:hypothetical protein G3M48_006536 [Beauveria asiatica]|uniref:Uncharacterized protein n=1 Tax=Beauveria asiatica TaxID=1069075 RepID=A0AAW0RPQ7_9HYPO